MNSGRQFTLGVVALSASLLASACGDSGTGTIESAESLREALGRAASGEIVELGPGTFEGPFDVPPGVLLRGAGRETRIHASAGEVGLRLLTLDTVPTSVTDMTVEASGTAGLTLTGRGAAKLADVVVTASSGVGIAASGPTSLTLVRVTVTADTAVTSTPPHHGIYVEQVANLEMESVEVRVMVGFGVLTVDSSTVWNMGTVDATNGVGVMVSGGRMRAAGVTVSATTKMSGLRPSYGVVLTETQVEMSNLIVRDSESVGLLLAGGSAGSLAGVSAHRNQAGGVWIQDSRGLLVSGEATENGLAGLVAVDSEQLAVSDFSARSTSLRPFQIATAPAFAGDGLHLARSVRGLSLARVALEANGRVGCVLELGGASTAELSIVDLRVEGPEGALGVVAQGGTLTAAWDSSVVRVGAVTEADSAFRGSDQVLPVLPRSLAIDVPAPPVAFDTPML